MTKLKQFTEQFFENRQEQSRIKTALWDAVPSGVYYFNLEIVLAHMLEEVIELDNEVDVYTKSAKDKESENDNLSPIPPNLPTIR